MKMIVAVDKEWGIGNKGDLLARVRADLQNFRRHTDGKTVVFGSNTLATFPGGRPLKNRTNIVLHPSSFEKDVFIPNLDDSPEWELTETSETQYSDPLTDTEPSLPFAFCTYKRIQ